MQLNDFCNDCALHQITITLQITSAPLNWILERSWCSLVWAAAATEIANAQCQWMNRLGSKPPPPPSSSSFLTHFFEMRQVGYVLIRNIAACLSYSDCSVFLLLATLPVPGMPFIHYVQATNVKCTNINSSARYFHFNTHSPTLTITFIPSHTHSDG